MNTFGNRSINRVNRVERVHWQINTAIQHKLYQEYNEPWGL